MTKSDPIRFILAQQVLSGRLTKWLMILSQFDVKAKTPTAVKSQALADLLSQFPSGIYEPVDETIPGGMEDVMVAEGTQEWKMTFDGSSTAQGGGAGIVLTSPEGKRISLSYKLDFPCTNNEAEYEALALGLQNAASLGIRYLCIEGDSKLIIEQTKGEFAVKEPTLLPYREVVRTLLKKFIAVDMLHKPRASNRHADALATVASKLDLSEDAETFEVQRKVMPCTIKELVPAEEMNDWRKEIREKLESPDTMSLPTLKNYIIIDDALFHRSSEGIITKCIGPQEAAKELKRLHEATCGMTGPPLYRRIQRYGYSWPSLKKEACELQRQCSECQGVPNQNEVLAITEEDWRTPYINFLKDRVLPNCQKIAEIIKKRSWKFRLSAEGKLLRHGFDQRLLKCLSDEEAQEAMREAHEGDCGEHQGGRRLYQLVLRHGLYWPTMEADSLDYAKKCKECQVHGNSIHAPQVELHALSTPWPFHTWTLDLVGPINPPSKGHMWILAATECFTKWVEAIPLKRATGQNVVRFIHENIICRFGIPNRILSDNGTPFVNAQMSDLTERYSIRHVRSSPYYPKGNGQSEATNKTILKILGKMVHEKHKLWSDYVIKALWAYRTSVRSATNYSPFSLVYGCECVAPIDVLREGDLGSDYNVQDILRDMEILDERRDNAARSHEVYRMKMTKAYDRLVRKREIKEGDWVLKSAIHIMRNLAAPKFTAKWEGPYLVHEANSNGMYKLFDPREETVSGPINAKWIKLYHI